MWSNLYAQFQDLINVLVFGVYSLHFLQDINLISKYCLGTYDNLPAQYTTIFHVKMLISHYNMKYFLPILLKQLIVVHIRTASFSN